MRGVTQHQEAVSTGQETCRRLGLEFYCQQAGTRRGCEVGNRRIRAQALSVDKDSKPHDCRSIGLCRSAGRNKAGWNMGEAGALRVSLTIRMTPTHDTSDP